MATPGERGLVDFRVELDNIGKAKSPLLNLESILFVAVVPDILSDGF